MAGQI